MFHRIQLDASDSDRNHWQCELMHRENYFPYLYIFGTGTYRGLQRGRGSELRSGKSGFPLGWSHSSQREAIGKEGEEMFPHTGKDSG